jgi:hypothetical protein
MKEVTDLVLSFIWTLIGIASIYASIWGYNIVHQSISFPRGSGYFIVVCLFLMGLCLLGMAICFYLQWLGVK